MSETRERCSTSVMTQDTTSTTNLLKPAGSPWGWWWCVSSNIRPTDTEGHEMTEQWSPSTDTCKVEQLCVRKNPMFQISQSVQSRHIAALVSLSGRLAVFYQGSLISVSLISWEMYGNWTARENKDKKLGWNDGVKLGGLCRVVGARSPTLAAQAWVYPSAKQWSPLLPKELNNSHSLFA